MYSFPFVFYLLFSSESSQVKAVCFFFLVSVSLHTFSQRLVLRKQLTCICSTILFVINVLNCSSSFFSCLSNLFLLLLPHFFSFFSLFFIFQLGNVWLWYLPQQAAAAPPLPICFFSFACVFLRGKKGEDQLRYNIKNMAAILPF